MPSVEMTFQESWSVSFGGKLMTTPIVKIATGAEAAPAIDAVVLAFSSDLAARWTSVERAWRPAQRERNFFDKRTFA
jgi:hypothetical protein